MKMWACLIHSNVSSRQTVIKKFWLHGMRNSNSGNVACLYLLQHKIHKRAHPFSLYWPFDQQYFCIKQECVRLDEVYWSDALRTGNMFCLGYRLALSRHTCIHHQILFRKSSQDGCLVARNISIDWNLHGSTRQEHHMRLSKKEHHTF